MKVFIDFYLPFKEVIGEKRIELEFQETTITMKELLKKIVDRYPAFLKQFTTDDIEIIYQNIAVLKGGNLLLLDDIIKDGDIIKIFSPMSGG
jgi:molybdopterin converting factor small subunit